MNFDEKTKNEKTENEGKEKIEKEKEKMISISSLEYDARSITKELIISILTLPLEKRVLSQKMILTFFCMNVSKLPQKFIKEHIDKASYNNIIKLSEPSFSYKLILYTDSLIYEVNDIANYFYIILNGSAKIIKPERYISEMNANEYYSLLMKYKKEKEFSLLEKTIKENYYIFPIDKNDLGNFEKIYLKVLMIKDEEKYSEEPIENILSKVGLKLSEFGIFSYEEEIEMYNRRINEENNILIAQKKINQLKGMIQFNYEKKKEKNREIKNKIKIILKDIPNNIALHYSFLSNEGKSPIIYFKFIDYKNVSTNDYFGDFENNKYIHRVISLSDELELLLMRNDIYVEFMRNQKTKIKAEQINFLVQNFFFTSISKYIFEKLYYDLFDFENYKINEIIVKENSKVDYLYFIKSGKVDLYSNKTVIENHLIINLIYDILKTQNKDYENKSIKNKYLKLYCLSYIQNFEKIDKEINTNKRNNLMIYQENQCIGHECFYYGFNYLYTAIAKSDVVELYKIRVDKLMKIIKDKNNIVFNDFAKKSWDTLLLLFKLMINLNSNLVKFYNNNKISKQKKNKDNKVIINDNNNIDEIKNNKINISRNYNSEIIKPNTNNLEKKMVSTNIQDEGRNVRYRKLPILSKSQNIRSFSFSFSKEENINKNEIKDKSKKLENISKIKNVSLYALHSYRSSISSNNISNINLKYKSKIFNASSIIYNNSSKKSQNIFENSLLKKLKKDNINYITLFNLSKNLYESKIDRNNDNSNSNIITFDFPLQKKYRLSNSVNNNESKYKDIDNDKKIISLRKNNKYTDFNNYYKFYSSEFYSYRDFIINNFKYNNKQSILTNKKLLKYGVLDLLRPKIRKKNVSFNFKLFGNINKKLQKNRTIYEGILDKYKNKEDQTP